MICALALKLHLENLFLTLSNLILSYCIKHSYLMPLFVCLSLTLLKFSCFSKYTWDISQVWQGIAEAKILSYAGVNPSKTIVYI